MCNCNNNNYKELIKKLTEIENQNELIISEIDYINRGVFGKEPTNTGNLEYRKA